MRIIHTCLRYPPATGGVETYVRELVERTRNIPTPFDQKEKTGEVIRDVRVLTSKLRTHGPISELHPDLLLDDPAYVQRLHHMATPLISYPRLQALDYYIRHHKPDIIHGHSFWYQPADTTARYAQKHNIPFIFHPYYYENQTRQKLVWQLYKSIVGRKTFAAAAAVIVISPFEQELITKNGFPVKRFILAPPGIDSKKYQQSQPNPFTSREIHGPVLLTVGRITKAKGLDAVINALPEIIKNIPDTQLAIVGEDFGERKALKRQIEQKGVSQHVHWLGKLNQNELMGAYQHATLIIHPSHYEAFGIAPAEALAAGTPVVARHAAALPYVVPDQKAGLLFETEEQLIKAILTLLKNPDLRERFGQAGKKHITENFSWNTTINKISKLYAELAGKTR